MSLLRILLSLFIFSKLSFASEIQVNPSIDSYMPGTKLLNTNWGQREDYNDLIPLLGDEQPVTGCGSTALGQIITFLRPQYIEQARFTHGMAQRDSILRYQNYLWDQILDAETNPENIIGQVERQKLLRDTAYALSTRFESGGGTTTSNVLSSQGSSNMWPLRSFALSEKVDFEFENSLFRDDSPSNREKMEQLKLKIKENIDARKPIYTALFGKKIIVPENIGRISYSYSTLDNLNTQHLGHSVVIDGYKEEHGEFLVHINWGWSGEANGFYNLFEGIHLFSHHMMYVVTSFYLIMDLTPIDPREGNQLLPPVFESGDLDKASININTQYPFMFKTNISNFIHLPITSPRVNKDYQLRILDNSDETITLNGDYLILGAKNRSMETVNVGLFEIDKEDESEEMVDNKVFTILRTDQNIIHPIVNSVTVKRQTNGDLSPIEFIAKGNCEIKAESRNYRTPIFFYSIIDHNDEVILSNSRESNTNLTLEPGKYRITLARGFIREDRTRIYFDWGSPSEINIHIRCNEKLSLSKEEIYNYYNLSLY